METDTAEGMIDTLAFWWATASVDISAGYPEVLAKRTAKQGSLGLPRFVHHAKTWRSSPSDESRGFEREKRLFSPLSGFETVSASNAFWWQK